MINLFLTVNVFCLHLLEIKDLDEKKIILNHISRRFLILMDKYLRIIRNYYMKQDLFKVQF